MKVDLTPLDASCRHGSTQHQVCTMQGLLLPLPLPQDLLLLPPLLLLVSRPSVFHSELHISLECLAKILIIGLELIAC